MRKISHLFSIFFIAISIPLASPSTSYKGDSTIVRELLDSCGLKSTQVSNVTTVKNNRIVSFFVDNPQIKIPQSIGNLVSLEYLYLIGKKDSIPISIGDLSNLIYLDIRNGWLADLPYTITKLKKLEVLKSSGNLFCNLPVDVENWLDALDRPGFDEWRNGQFCLKSPEDSIIVRNLLDTNHLNTISIYEVATSQKERISSIEIHKKNISILPPDIGNLSGLKRLVLPGNSISTLPGSVTKLTSLTMLDLYYNYLCSIPDSIAAWIEKYHIPYGDDFKASQICCIQKDIDIVRAILDMNGLKEYSVWEFAKVRNGRIYNIFIQKEIKIIPEAIGELDSLKYLHIEPFISTKLPNSFTKLINLEYIYVCGTLEYLPDNIDSMSNLTTIELFCNLKSLSNSICKLLKLKRLVIQGCLGSLPDSIIKLNNIEYLSIGNNYLCNVPPAIDSFLCKYNNSWISEQWCCNNANDTLIIRKLLDTNQLFTTPVRSVTSAHNGRILEFKPVGVTNKIKYLTSQIGDLDSLKRLEINSNYLTEIPSSIGKLSKLQMLELGYNKLKSLPDSLQYCSSLTSIGVNGNWLCNLPNTFKDWINVRSYDPNWLLKQNCITYQSDLEIIQRILDTNNITNDIWTNITVENGRVTSFILPVSSLIIPEYIQNLDSLKKIDVPFSWQVQPIRKDALLNIFKLKNLKDLTLPTSGIDSLPEEIKNLHNLEILDLRGNDLRFITDSIGCLKKLRILNISSCKTSMIPHSIGDCDSLCALYCDNSSLDSLPFEISKCKKLDTFYISNCNLQYIPNSICKLDSIHVLNVNGNILCDVSDSVKAWLNLHSPSWKNNQFCVSDPNEIKIVRELLDVNGLDSVRVRDIAKTENGRISEINIEHSTPNITQYIHFSILPSSIGQLTALKKISITIGEWEDLNICIESIPETIGLLDSLKELTIVYAKIKKIPESLYNLKSIQMINLQGNQIRTISGKISQLTTLNELQLNNNKINALPQSIVSLSNLTDLDIGGNALCQLPGTTKIWVDQFDPDWAASQTCSEIRNQLYLTSQPIEKNRIAIHWDLSTTHSEADSIDIWYSQSGFPLNPDSSTATHFETYPVYTFRDTLDTLNNCATNTIYYFSAFQRLGTYTTDTGITAMKAVKAMSTPLLFGHNDISKLSVTYVNGTDSVSVYYKLLDYGEQKNVTSLFYRVGMNNVWTKCSELLGDADSVDATDSSVVRCIKWVARNQLNGTVQTDSLQLMFIAKDMADLQDTLVSAPSVHLDMLPPANVTNFKATAKEGRSISLTWQPSVSPDAIQIMIRYSTDGIWPDSPEKGTALSQTPDTVSNFVISDVLEKVVYRFCVFVKDSANNWSLYSPQASDSVRSLDETNPLELTDLFFTAKQCSTGVLTWQKSLSSDADSIYFVFRADSTYPLTPDSGILLLKVNVSSPCSLHISNLKSGNALYLAAFVRDSSGNFSNGTNTLLITKPPVCIIKSVNTEVSDTVKISIHFPM